MTKVKSETAPKYQTGRNALIEQQDETINEALRILEMRLKKPGTVISNPNSIKQYLALRLAEQKNEQFCVVFLDNRNSVLDMHTLFHGTIDGSSVHPRVVVQAILEVNAAAVIFAHNHPSGEPEPSRADITLTRRLVDACKLIEVSVLDHIIIGGTASVSFAERGLI